MFPCFLPEQQRDQRPQLATTATVHGHAGARGFNDENSQNVPPHYHSRANNSTMGWDKSHGRPSARFTRPSLTRRQRREQKKRWEQEKQAKSEKRKIKLEFILQDMQQAFLKTPKERKERRERKLNRDSNGQRY